MDIISLTAKPEIFWHSSDIKITNIIIDGSNDSDDDDENDIANIRKTHPTFSILLHCSRMNKL